MVAPSRGEDLRQTGTLEVELTRVLPAPRAIVFRAWTDPEHIRFWSAPHGYEITHAEGEVRPGGSWRACMRSADGEELWLGGVYRQVVKDRLLEFTQVWDEDGEETHVSVRFEDERGKTRMVFRQSGFGTVESREGHELGWSECFERLHVLLTAQTTP